MDKLPKLGIVGCGAIGGEVARYIDRGLLNYDLAALCDTEPSQSASLVESLSRCTPCVTTLESLTGECDVILESAQASAVGRILLCCADSIETSPPGGISKSCVVMSVGGIAGLSEEDFERLDRAGIKVHVPSGAVGGVDALLAMRESGLVSVTLTTRKPPKALGREDSVETAVFEGSAGEAIKAFPKNINVAMTIRLAIGGAVPFTVRIVSDPALTVNSHTIEAVSKAGKCRMTFENEPHPDMPRTSYLAPMSAVAILRKIEQSFQVGT